MKVLVVDDDPDIAEAVNMCFTLRWPDATILEAPDGATAVRMVSESSPDVVILDIGLPDMNGFQVCQLIRESSDVPIVMLTARGDQVDKVRGLELGADDYITKPFNHIELLARIRAVLRRVHAGMVEAVDDPFEKGGLTFEFSGHEVRYNGEKLLLTPLEYNLLFHLVRGYPRVVQHRTLLGKVWGAEYVNETDYLKVHVQRIRAKFAAIAPGFDPITNERGVGYRLSLPDAAD